MPQKGKTLNPEEKLQASVAQDIQIRILQDAAKRQKDAMCIAKWENDLGKKDVIARRQRDKERAKEDSMYSREVNKETRKARLEELYLNDELYIH